MNILIIATLLALTPPQDYQIIETLHLNQWVPTYGELKLSDSSLTVEIAGMETTCELVKTDQLESVEIFQAKCQGTQKGKWRILVAHPNPEKRVPLEPNEKSVTMIKGARQISYIVVDNK